MRVHALSDVHVDYASNARWVENISQYDYRDDVLILAGDVSDRIVMLEWCLRALVARFKKVLFVPGNHDLWVMRDRDCRDSLEKLQRVAAVAQDSGASMRPYVQNGLAFIPLLAWYDYSFGAPSEELQSMWGDFVACRWPEEWSAADVAQYFSDLNDCVDLPAGATEIITYSHFLPRIDVMPAYIPHEKRLLYPVLGTRHLDVQVRSHASRLHVYGHSHVNRTITIDGVCYINNAFGYPQETHITSKQLLCIREC